MQPFVRDPGKTAGDNAAEKGMYYEKLVARLLVKWGIPFQRNIVLQQEGRTIAEIDILLPAHGCFLEVKSMAIMCKEDMEKWLLPRCVKQLSRQERALKHEFRDEFKGFVVLTCCIDNGCLPKDDRVLTLSTLRRTLTLRAKEEASTAVKPVLQFV